MKFSNTSLLQILVEEYAEFIKESVVIRQPVSISESEEDSGVNDFARKCYEVEMDEKCNRLEEEILMMNYQASRKRSSDLSWEREKSKTKRSRPTSYDI